MVLAVGLDIGLDVCQTQRKTDIEDELSRTPFNNECLLSVRIVLPF